MRLALPIGEWIRARRIVSVCTQRSLLGAATAVAVGLCLAACREHGGSVRNAQDAGRAAVADGATADATRAPSSRADAAADDADAGEGDAGRAVDANIATDGDADVKDAAASNVPRVRRILVGGYDALLRTFTFDEVTSAWSEPLPPVDAGKSPTFLARTNDSTSVFVANEAGGTSAGVTALSISDAGLKSRGRAVAADGLVFTEVDPGQKFVLAVSYSGGFVSVFPIVAGSIAASVAQVNFPKPASESSAQTHCVRVHPNGKTVYVANKALNSVAQFQLDGNGQLTPLSKPAVTSAGGPRHIAIDAEGKRAVAITELSNELVSYAISDDGQLVERQRISTLPPSYKSANTGAHVLIHPSGKYVYASNRGHDSIATFEFEADGALTLVDHVSTQGSTPRNFDMSRDGRMLVVANQNSGTAVPFSVGLDGRLAQAGAALKGLTSPAAVAILD
jgi:6-phosphogluconolactonase